MIDKKYLEMINKDIDGLLTDKEAGKLEEYLLQNQEAKAYHDNLKSMANRLQSTPALEPSVNLKKHIMNAIPRNKYKAKAKTSSPFLAFVRLNIKYAYAFSLGLLIGISLLTLSNLVSPDQSSLTGTLLFNQPDNISSMARTDITTDEVHGTIRLNSSDGLVTVEALFNSLKTGNLQIQFDAADLKFMQFSQLIDGALNVDINENNLQFNYSSGNNGYAIIFKDKTLDESKISVTIKDENKTIFEKQITPEVN